MAERFEIATERLTLRPWQPTDGDDFARMNADREVMADLGGPLDRAASDQKLQRFTRVYRQNGFTRWVISSPEGTFLGYTGVTPVADEHPLGAHHEIGWRLNRYAWGHGYATEAASAALDDALGRVGLSRVLAYTAADNVRSQAVMDRLGLKREPALDFTAQYDGTGPWSGLVWVATRQILDQR